MENVCSALRRPAFPLLQTCKVKRQCTKQLLSQVVWGDEKFVLDPTLCSTLQDLSRKFEELIICWTFIWFAAIVWNNYALFIPMFTYVWQAAGIQAVTWCWLFGVRWCCELSNICAQKGLCFHVCKLRTGSGHWRAIYGLIYVFTW